MSCRVGKASVSIPMARYALFMPSMWVLCAFFMPSMCIVSGRGLLSSHVMPALACVVAGIYGCGIQESALLNMKTRHCISGCVRVVPSGLWCSTPHSHGTTMPSPHAVIADLPLSKGVPEGRGIKVPRPPEPQEDYPLVVASRHREARSSPFMIDSCKIYFQNKKPH